MSQKTETQQHQPVKSHAPPPKDIEKLRQKEEMKEVIGRHQNDGQKDHKGAR